MLLTLKEDNTAGCFYLCCLLHMRSVINKCRAICTSLHLYTIIILQMAYWYICVYVSFWSLHVCYAIGYICIGCSMHMFHIESVI